MIRSALALAALAFAVCTATPAAAEFRYGYGVEAYRYGVHHGGQVGATLAPIVSRGGVAFPMPGVWESADAMNLMSSGACVYRDAAPGNPRTIVSVEAPFDRTCRMHNPNPWACTTEKGSDDYARVVGANAKPVYREVKRLIATPGLHDIPGSRLIAIGIRACR